MVFRGYGRDSQVRREKCRSTVQQKRASCDDNNGSVLYSGDVSLKFGEDEADSAYDVVGWGFVGGEGE
jgi:hypothetical protein